MNPLVSIIIPVKNCAEWLPAAVASVREQSLSAWELLIVDNGSTDGSLDVARELSGADERIRVFEQARPGVSAARNTGLEQASGRYVAFLDADDRLPAGCLAARVNYLETHRHITFLDGKVITFDADFSNVISRWMPNFRGAPLDALASLDGSCFRGITWMIRRDHIGEVRFREDMRHSEDLAFYIDLAARGGNYDFIKSEVYHIRRRGGSLMSDLDGLAEGYRQLDKVIGEQHPAGQAAYRKKMRKILFRSYLKAGRPLQALRWWL